MKKRKIDYFSLDKMYSIKNDMIKNHPKVICIFLFAVSCLFLLVSTLTFIKSFNFDETVEKANYSINGASDYTVYLKDNDYYETDYLNSGMKYVASLINTINVKFDYEVHANKDLDLDYTYKIVGNLKVYDKDNSGKVLYTKIYDLSEPVSKKINSNNLVINEDVNIDYGLYNEHVNKYLAEYGLLADAELEVSLNVYINGEYDHSQQNIASGKVMTIKIPLSEQTLDIKIDNSEVSSSDRLFDSSSYSVSNLGLFIVSAITLIISVYLVVLSTKLTKKYIDENIYTITLNKILKEYDRIIVNGNVTIDENKFSNKVYIDSFEELVDASQSFNEPILFYDVVPGEKCFFIIIKGDTLYKKRLSKAYLENQKRIKNSVDEVTKKDKKEETTEKTVTKKTVKKQSKKSGK